MLADFDFAWLPGTPNQKVLEFEADDPVWGVSSQPDDCYDLFMLAYHLYITYFEVRRGTGGECGSHKDGRGGSWKGPGAGTAAQERGGSCHAQQRTSHIACPAPLVPASLPPLQQVSPSDRATCGAARVAHAWATRTALCSVCLCSQSTPHTYHTYRPSQLLERNPSVCNDVFARAWRKSNTALEMGDEDGAKLWRLSGMNDVRE